MLSATIKAWDFRIGGLISTISMLSNAKPKAGDPTRPNFSKDDQRRLDDAQKSAGERAFVILKKVMLRQSMASRIPFHTGDRIVKIPRMEMKTEGVRFANDGSLEL